jgi:flagellar hook protein FlgE
MALSNTLYAGLSGLDVNQAKLNVVGNNIANVNTVAFKSTRVLFKPQFYVTDSGGSQPGDTSGGTNPSQIGLGAVVAATDRNLAPGAIEATGNATDLAIDGNGYFIVKGDGQKYTRAGSFSLNSDKQLVTATGEFVQGYSADKNFNISSGQLTNLTIPLGSLTTAQATTKVTVEGNLNSDGAVASGASIIQTQALTMLGGGMAPGGATALTNVASTADSATPLFAVGQSFTLEAQKGTATKADMAPATFTVTAASTLDDLMSFFQGSLGINAAVPDDGNPATPTAGVTLQAVGGDPASVNLLIVGNLGAENALTLANSSFATGSTYPFQFREGTDAAGNTSNPTGESVKQTAIIYDSLGTPITLEIRADFESKSTAGNTWRFNIESPDASNGNRAVGTGTLTFDGSGNLLSVTGNQISIPRENTGAVTPLNLQIDFGQIKGLSEETSTVTMTAADGSAIGQLNSFSIGQDGIITGNFSNGVHRTLGQVALATFSNAQGLVDRGGNMFAEGPNSGPAVIGTPGDLGAGKLVSGSLEMSNVDLSEEFINLIIASTGFSAASRVISTSDQLLQQLLSTGR